MFQVKLGYSAPIPIPQGDEVIRYTHLRRHSLNLSVPYVYSLLFRDEAHVIERLRKLGELTSLPGKGYILYWLSKQ